MEETNNSFSLSSLLCQESEACFNDDEEDESPYFNWNPCFKSENEDEYIENLVQRETSFGSKTNAIPSDNCSTGGPSWLKCARLDAIEWMLNTRAIFGFKYHTAYLSATYFDRFLSKRSIDDGKLWAIRLLSVACLSLAAKMEERRVPPLSEFPIQDYDFEDKVILRMELLVLSTLEWQMGSVTPFAYLHYFTSKIFSESRPKELLSRAVDLILAVSKEINLMDHRPSTLAAAAVLAATDSQLTRKAVELKMELISLWGSPENENVYCCYNLMQEIEMGKCKTPKLVLSPNVSSGHSSSIDLIESSCFSSGARIKRRLTFNDSDQSCLVKKICRP